MATSSAEKQHIGRVSDSLTDDDDRAAIHAKLRSVMKPTGKTFRKDGHDLGDGDRCPTVDASGQSLGHGKMYVLPDTGKQWCPHQSHDMGVPRSGTYAPKEPQDA